MMFISYSASPVHWFDAWLIYVAHDINCRYDLRAGIVKYYVVKDWSGCKGIGGGGGVVRYSNMKCYVMNYTVFIHNQT